MFVSCHFPDQKSDDGAVTERLLKIAQESSESEEKNEEVHSDGSCVLTTGAVGMTFSCRVWTRQFHLFYDHFLITKQVVNKIWR